jgi:hypothetical protein
MDSKLKRASAPSLPASAHRPCQPLPLSQPTPVPAPFPAHLSPFSRESRPASAPHLIPALFCPTSWPTSAPWPESAPHPVPHQPLIPARLCPPSLSASGPRPGLPHSGQHLPLVGLVHWQASLLPSFWSAFSPTQTLLFYSFWSLPAVACPVKHPFHMTQAFHNLDDQHQPTRMSTGLQPYNNLVNKCLI